MKNLTINQFAATLTLNKNVISYEEDSTTIILHNENNDKTASVETFQEWVIINSSERGDIKNRKGSVCLTVKEATVQLKKLGLII